MDLEQKKIINKTIEVLRNGGTILYPSDTIWGIGCDATNEKAIKKIYKIKKRQKNKPLIIIIENPKLLHHYIQTVPKVAHQIIDQSEKPTTIIYNNPTRLPKMLLYNNSIGIRVVKNHCITHLLKQFNKPITSTSANISDSKSPKSFSDIDSCIKNNVDYIVPEKFVKSNLTLKSSKIIRIQNNSTIDIIRH